MTRRQADWLLAGYAVLFVFVMVMALVLTWKNRTKPSVFIAPAIWSIPHTGGEPRIEFNI